MKNKLKNILMTLPLCLPYTYLLLYAEMSHESWIRKITLAIVIALALLYGFHGKKPQIIAGGLISGITTFVITCFTQEIFANAHFFPFTTLQYAAFLSAFIFISQLLISLAVSSLTQMVKSKFGESKTVKAVLTAVIIAAVVICFSAGTCIGYIAGDFEKDGIDSAEYSGTYLFDETENIEIKNITAKIVDGEIVSESDRLNIGSSYYATVSQAESGNLMLHVHEELAYYTPFNIVRTDFCEGKKNENGEYDTLTFPWQSGTDKNGGKITLQYMGGNKITTDGIHTTDYMIIDEEGNYLTADDIDGSFPLTVTLEGHPIKYTRKSLF